ncbi:glycerol-3-phosphate dehydrogenase [Siccirubricoccus sp. KC 17139]|uniref:Glycerol-3-phosphate dehydrogenase n=1 Tax=Siccirubricoccus soli TaxID=2899147 RepID=A0ABT1D587_9PROT|nr:glycerol-3-phosphate dehydrogenase [Siccirubricoccus soli]MCO6417071.1 glycerol-3-phosphate dehydrogenase [Siccirubricoccus soli]MCP2683206.1 glycerol-3-phosphate dehydrogenase [Siccirubricoccus soli]
MAADTADMLRQAAMRDSFDLLVIGGGVNGAGIARDAAGRGLSVLLAERGDLAGATSSASSKLIHGGLRYLEHYEFRLVREALAEREVLLRLAPHIIWPLRFVLPHRPAMRSRLLIRAGLFLYDHLARRVSLKGAESLDPHTHPWGAPLSPDIHAAFAYSDCWVQDSRLVVLNARDAAQRGAEIAVRTAFAGATREAAGWRCILREAGGRERQVRARALVNAAGPWVMQAQGAAQVPAPDRVRLVRGSHIVLPALYEGPQAYILQNDDGRVVFVIPYEERFSLVGTTDVPHEGDPGAARCTPEEAAYLCAAVGRQFRRAPRPEEAVWSYSGVRPLHDDGAANPSAVTRDYVLKLDTAGAPLLSVFGGKITTFRRLAEEAVGKLAPLLGCAAPAWTARATLPGGDFGGLDLPGFEAEAARRWPFLPPGVARRMVRSYGAEMERLLAGATRLADLGAEFGGGLTERELDWLVREEWARGAEDVLWRRSKLGLRLSAEQRAAVAEWMGAPPPTLAGGSASCTSAGGWTTPRTPV